MRDSLFDALDGMEMGKSEHDWLEQRFGSMTAKERLLFQRRYAAGAPSNR